MENTITKEINFTITGGTITKQKGSSVTYKMKCEKCGYVALKESTVTVTRGVTEVSTEKCFNCENNQVIKLKHIAD